MNAANAVTFLSLGFVMGLLPLVLPGLFPPAAIDGSSARALWLEIMGLVQTVLAAAYLLNGPQRLQRWAASLRAAVRVQPASVTAGADEPIIPDAVFASAAAARRGVAVEPIGSITLHGEHADLWRAFNDALHANGPARQVALRLFSLMQDAGSTPGVVPISAGAGTDGGGDGETENVVDFGWANGGDHASVDERELAGHNVA